MKYFLFTVLFSIYLAPAVSQVPQAGKHDPKNSYFPADLTYISLRLPNIREQGNYPSPSYFSHFEVWDARPDTARIGLHLNANMSFIPKAIRQLVFKMPASREIGGFLNTHFCLPGAEYDCLVVIRQLWLSDAIYTNKEIEDDPDLRYNKTRISFKAEVYAVKGLLYTPLIRLDTTLITRREMNWTARNSLGGMLQEMIARAHAIGPTEQVNKGRRLNAEEIKVFNQSGFELPIYTDSVLVRGVYKNFEEFKNNAPSIAGYEVREEKGSLLLYIKEGGADSYYSHKVWGYCDGKNVFMLLDGDLYPVWKEQKSFYLLGSKERVVSSTRIPIIIPAGPFGYSIVNQGATLKGKPQLRIRIFSLDMENGRIF